MLSPTVLKPVACLSVLRCTRAPSRCLLLEGLRWICRDKAVAGLEGGRDVLVSHLAGHISVAHAAVSAAVSFCRFHRRKMFHLSSLALASFLFLYPVSSSPLNNYYANTTTAPPTVSSSGGASDSSCGGCKIVADDAHLLYWNPLITSIVETDVSYGINISTTFISTSHPITLGSLPAAAATRTIVFSLKPEYANNATSSPYTATETISGFTA